MKNYAFGCLFAIAILALMSMNSCSIVGYAIGTGVDSSAASQLPLKNLINIPRNSQLKLTLKNGEVRKGKYMFKTPSSDEDGQFSAITCLDANNRYFATPISDIAKVEIMDERNRAGAIGFGIGALVDVTLLILAPSGMGKGFNPIDSWDFE